MYVPKCWDMGVNAHGLGKKILPSKAKNCILYCAVMNDECRETTASIGGNDCRTNG